MNFATVLHNALLLIGYNNASHEVDPAMFDKANAKAFDSILHFLLVKLRGTSQAKKVGATIQAFLLQPSLQSSRVKGV